MLIDLRMDEEEKIELLKKEIIDKQRRGEDFEPQYQAMLKARKSRDIYSNEEKELIHKQFALVQNFVKLIDKNINDMEKDKEFLKHAEDTIRK